MVVKAEPRTWGGERREVVRPGGLVDQDGGLGRRSVLAGGD